MDLTQAKTVLTAENIATTAITLSALDVLQSHFYRNFIDRELRKDRKFSESDVCEQTKPELKRINGSCLMMNGHGMKANLSVFLNGMHAVGLDEQARSAVSSWESFEASIPHES